MLFGAILALIGFYAEFFGKVEHDFDVILFGWVMVITGLVIFISHALELAR